MGSANRCILAGFALVPSAAPAAPSVEADAELIRLCNRIVAIEAENDRLCSGPAAYPCDDPVIGPQIDALDEENEATMARIAIMRPATLAGVRALARVVSCLIECDDRLGYLHGGERDQALRPALEWLTRDDGGECCWMPPPSRSAPAAHLVGRA